MAINPAAPTDPNELTDTFQWDTVFAIKIKDVNAAIKSAGSSPVKMDYTLDGGGEVACTFGDWSIDSSGDGSLIHLNIPVNTCTFSLNGKSETIDGFNCIAEVQMHYYDTVSNDPNATGNFQNLKIKSHKDTLQDQLVSGVNSNFGTQSVSVILQGLINEALENWLNENIQIFDHIFATVNLNRLVSNGSYEWLLPTQVGYAFINNADSPDDSVLGVLCMTEKRTSGNLVTEVSHNAIPTSSQSGFLIAQSRLINKMILPTLPSAFQGLTADDFTITDEDKTIELKSTDKAFTVTHENKTYNANIEAFTLSLEGKQLTLHSETKTEITAGIYAHTSSDHVYQLALYTKTDGTQSIKYQEVGKPVVNQWTSQDEGVTISEIIAGIIAGVILAILIVLTDGLVLIAVVIIGGLLVGLISNISNIIRLVGTDDAPDISMLVLNCTDPIQWTGQSHFSLNYVALNGPLQMGGFFKG
jgi:Clostridium P-47 protein